MMMKDSPNNETNPSSSDTLGIKNPLGCLSPLGQSFISPKFISPLGAKSITRANHVFANTNDYLIQNHSDSLANIGDRSTSRIDSPSISSPAINNSPAVRLKPQTKAKTIEPQVNQNQRLDVDNNNFGSEQLQRQTEKANTTLPLATPVSEYSEQSSNENPIQQQPNSISEKDNFAANHSISSNPSSDRSTKAEDVRAITQTNISRKIDSSFENSNNNLSKSTFNKLTSFIQQKSESIDTDDFTPLSSPIPTDNSIQEKPAISRTEIAQDSNLEAPQQNTTQSETISPKPGNSSASASPIQREIDAQFLANSTSPRSNQRSNSFKNPNPIASPNQIQREEISTTNQSENFSDNQIDSSEIEVQRQQKDLPVEKIFSSSELVSSDTSFSATPDNIQRQQVARSQNSNYQSSTENDRSHIPNQIQREVIPSGSVQPEADNSQAITVNNSDNSRFNNVPEIQTQNIENPIVQSDTFESEIPRKTISSNHIQSKIDPNQAIANAQINKSSANTPLDLQTGNLDTSKKAQSIISESVQLKADNSQAITVNDSENSRFNNVPEIQTQNIENPLVQSDTFESEIPRKTISSNHIQSKIDPNQAIANVQINKSSANTPPDLQTGNRDTSKKTQSSISESVQLKADNSQAITVNNSENSRFNNVPEIQTQNIESPLVQSDTFESEIPRKTISSNHIQSKIDPNQAISNAQTNNSSSNITDSSSTASSVSQPTNSNLDNLSNSNRVHYPQIQRETEDPISTPFKTSDTDNIAVSNLDNSTNNTFQIQKHSSTLSTASATTKNEQHSSHSNPEKIQNETVDSSLDNSALDINQATSNTFQSDNLQPKIQRDIIFSTEEVRENSNTKPLDQQEASIADTFTPAIQAKEINAAASPPISSELNDIATDSSTISISSPQVPRNAISAQASPTIAENTILSKINSSNSSASKIQQQSLDPSSNNAQKSIPETITSSTFVDSKCHTNSVQKKLDSRSSRIEPAANLSEPNQSQNSNNFNQIHQQHFSNNAIASDNSISSTIDTSNNSLQGKLAPQSQDSTINLSNDSVKSTSDENLISVDSQLSPINRQTQDSLATSDSISKPKQDTSAHEVIRKTISPDSSTPTQVKEPSEDLSKVTNPDLKSETNQSNHATAIQRETVSSEIIQSEITESDLTSGTNSISDNPPNLQQQLIVLPQTPKQTTESISNKNNPDDHLQREALASESMPSEVVNSPANPNNLASANPSQIQRREIVSSSSRSISQSNQPQSNHSQAIAPRSASNSQPYTATTIQTEKQGLSQETQFDTSQTEIQREAIASAPIQPKVDHTKAIASNDTNNSASNITPEIQTQNLDDKLVQSEAANSQAIATQDATSLNTNTAQLNTLESQSQVQRITIPSESSEIPTESNSKQNISTPQIDQAKDLSPSGHLGNQVNDSNSNTKVQRDLVDVVSGKPQNLDCPVISQSNQTSGENPSTQAPDSAIATSKSDLKHNSSGHIQREVILSASTASQVVNSPGNPKNSASTNPAHIQRLNSLDSSASKDISQSNQPQVDPAQAIADESRTNLTDNITPQIQTETLDFSETNQFSISESTESQVANSNVRRKTSDLANPAHIKRQDISPASQDAVQSHQSEVGNLASTTPAVQPERKNTNEETQLNTSDYQIQREANSPHPIQLKVANSDAIAAKETTNSTSNNTPNIQTDILDSSPIAQFEVAHDLASDNPTSIQQKSSDLTPVTKNVSQSTSQENSASPVSPKTNLSNRIQSQVDNSEAITLNNSIDLDSADSASIQRANLESSNNINSSSQLSDNNSDRLIDSNQNIDRSPLAQKKELKASVPVQSTIDKTQITSVQDSTNSASNITPKIQKLNSDSQPVQGKAGNFQEIASNNPTSSNINPARFNTSTSQVQRTTIPSESSESVTKNSSELNISTPQVDQAIEPPSSKSLGEQVADSDSKVQRDLGSSQTSGEKISPQNLDSAIATSKSDSKHDPSSHIQREAILSAPTESQVTNFPANQKHSFPAPANPSHIQRQKLDLLNSSTSQDISQVDQSQAISSNNSTSSNVNPARFNTSTSQVQRTTIPSESSKSVTKNSSELNISPPQVDQAKEPLSSESLGEQVADSDSKVQRDLGSSQTSGEKISPQHLDSTIATSKSDSKHNPSSHIQREAILSAPTESQVTNFPANQKHSFPARANPSHIQRQKLASLNSSTSEDISQVDQSQAIASNSSTNSASNIIPQIQTEKLDSSESKRSNISEFTESQISNQNVNLKKLASDNVALIQPQKLDPTSQENSVSPIIKKTSLPNLTESQVDNSEPSTLSSSIDLTSTNPSSIQKVNLESSTIVTNSSHQLSNSNLGHSLKIQKKELEDLAPVQSKINKSQITYTPDITNLSFNDSLTIQTKNQDSNQTINSSDLLPIQRHTDNLTNTKSKENEQTVSELLQNKINIDTQPTIQKLGVIKPLNKYQEQQKSTINPLFSRSPKSKTITNETAGFNLSNSNTIHRKSVDKVNNTPDSWSNISELIAQTDQSSQQLQTKSSDRQFKSPKTKASENWTVQTSAFLPPGVWQSEQGATSLSFMGQSQDVSVKARKNIEARTKLKEAASNLSGKKLPPITSQEIQGDGIENLTTVTVNTSSELTETLDDEINDAKHAQSIDILAREVYSLLRQQLELERERHGGSYRRFR